MHTRYMERTNSMKGGGKRSLEDDGGSEEKQEPDKKRPALARYKSFLKSSLLICVL